MATKSQIAPEDTGASRFLPLLLLLFMASGFSALVYEIVWYQLLQLTIGSTAVSLGVLLATFMGGLCIGSIVFPRFRAALARPLRFYAFLELGMGLCSILVLFAIPYIDRVYFAAIGYGLPGMLLRAFLCAVCLLPPTAFMGASLPVLARWIESSPRGISWWGLLYSGNTVGAVFGCLFAGFYLLRIYNVSIATYVAAAINLLVAAIEFRLGSKASPASKSAGKGEKSPCRHGQRSLCRTPLTRWSVYVAIGISGATALGAEVVWTRLMGMMLGSTVYVFSIILAVFLVGLAAGGAGGALLLAIGEAPPRPRLVPDAAVSGHRLVRLQHLGLVALLAHQHFAFQRAVVHVSTRSGPLPLGHPARHSPLGRKFPSGLGGSGIRRRGLGPVGGRNLCRQHFRRHRRSVECQFGADSLDRHAAIAAAPARFVGDQRPVRPGPLYPRILVPPGRRLARRLGFMRCAPGVDHKANTRRSDRLWTPERHETRAIDHHLHRGREKFVGGHFALE